MRSIPEKTLEHWASIYATYRYRSHAGLWWPSQGEDISLGNTPGRGSGKVFNLEIKTTESSPAGTTHTATVRVAQLHRYMKSPIPTYYVFPVPGWEGEMDHSTGLTWIPSGVAPPWESHAELGFTRSGDRWFGEWSFVISDRELFYHISATYPIASVVGKKVEETLFTAKVDASGVVSIKMGKLFSHLAPPTPPISLQSPSFTGPPGTAGGKFYRWRDFWDTMDLCGGTTALPAAFLVSSSSIGTRSTNRSNLVTTIREGGSSSPETVLFAPEDRYASPTEDQQYTLISQFADSLEDEPRETAEDSEEHRTTIFISSHVVRQAFGDED